MSKKNFNTLQNHFFELRNRIIFCAVFFISAFIFCYFFSENIYNILLRPFLEFSAQNPNRRLIYTSPGEAFTTYLKLSLYSAIFFSFPVFVTQIYLFLSPALYKNEKKNVLLIFFFTPFLFLCGAIFSYFFVLPITLEFFLSFENQGFSQKLILPIHLEIKISEYLKFVINLLFSFGIAFISPILLLFLIKVGLLSVNDLRKKRRYWIVIIFIIAAVLTPPDVLSQLSLAIAMIFLFEIVILIGKNL